MGLGGEHHPRLVLAARIAFRPRRRIVGVDLDRKPLAREQIFDEQLRIAPARLLEPDFPDGIAALGHIIEAGPQIGAAPRLFDAFGGEASGGHGDLPVGALQYAAERRRERCVSWGWRNRRFPAAPRGAPMSGKGGLRPGLGIA